MPGYETPSLFEQDDSVSDSSGALVSDLRAQLKDQADKAFVAKQAARGQVPGSSETPDSAVQADLGGGRTEKRENRLPKKPSRPVVTHGFSTELGRVVQSDSDITAQRTTHLLAEKREESREIAGQDDEDRKRNQAGIAAARAANPPMEPEVRSRAHVLREGDPVPFVPSANEDGDPIGSR